MIVPPARNDTVKAAPMAASTLSVGVARASAPIRAGTAVNGR